ncbi:MAG: T9SS type A sorting domain-containing protein [Lewinellaceae bacterium]|nr:T9SS type A sorting domain-containing protein [Lewinellaceae bacterium]
MDGTDHLPEVFVGRFNAATVEQLQVMVARNLDYEMTPLVDTTNNWTATAMASCSDQGQGIGDDNQADWQQGNEWKVTHLADGYEKVWEFYDGDHSADSPTLGDESADLAGDPVNSQLVQLMNNRGVSLYNYTGHGWEQGLASANFNVDAVAQLRNAHRYPIVIAVACCAGNFTNNGGGDCLGEAIQRAGNASTGEAWGGIAGFFSSDYQSWSPPMEGQDGMNQYLVDADGIDLRPHIGPMAAFGNALMIIAYNNGGEVMADFWNPFAEPTTVPRTRAAKTITASNPGNLYIGESSLAVDCDVEGALVSLYWEGQTLALAAVENGQAVLDFPALTNVGDLVVTVTQFNYTPVQMTLNVTPASGPFVVNELLELDDALGNNNQQADYGEKVAMNLQLANVGYVLAIGTSVTLSTTDDNVVILDGDEIVGDIEDSTSVFLSGAFSFSVNDDVQDGHTVWFTLEINFNDTMGYALQVPVVLQAPQLSVGSFLVDDTQGGNGNNRLESGETAVVTITNLNNGKSNSLQALGTLTSNSPFLSISPAQNLGTLDALIGNTDASFSVTVDPNAPAVSAANFHYTLEAGYYGAEADLGPLFINAIIEDFETHTFSKFDWVMGDDKPWTITTVQTYSGQYCSRSGTITHNQKTTMSLTLDVTETGVVSFARRVSSEENYDFLRFYIDSIEIDAWSGEKPWAEVSYPVTPGIHQFSWVYAKDDYASAGSDRAWLDEISLPPHQVFVATQLPATLSSNMAVYPNPGTGSATLYLENVANQGLQIDVLDNTGRLLKTLYSAARQPGDQLYLPVQMDQAKAGMYYFRVRSDAGVQVLKWVKL